MYDFIIDSFWVVSYPTFAYIVRSDESKLGDRKVIKRCD